MKRFFRNIPWKNILIIGLVVVLGIGAVAGISAIAKEEKKTISSTAFKRGAIDQNGFYVESENSIYTKDLIECQGLEIAPDFESTGTYQVFYYGSDKQFIGATEVLDSQSDGVYVKGDNLVIAKYCRIMITPETPKDEDGHVIDDYKIKFYEVAGIANKFTISVNKEQNYAWKDVYVVDESMVGKYYGNSLTDIREMGSYIPSKVIDLKGYTEVVVVIKNLNHRDAITQLCLFDANNSTISSINFDNDVLEFDSNVATYTLVIPEGASSAVLNGVYNNNYCIYVR